MVEHYKHILDEITVPDILTYLCARVSQEEDELRRRRNADVTYMKNCSTCKHLAKPFNLCCYSLGDEDYDCNGKKWEGIENA